MYVFGIRAESPHLQNAALDAFINKILQDNAVPYDILDYLEDNAHNSALWDLVMDVVWHCGSKADVKTWRNSLQGKGSIRNRNKKEVKEYLRRECAAVCGVYHEHPEADERDGELFFFDPPVKTSGGG